MSTISHVALLALGFVATPIVLDGLGTVAFGVYSAIASLTAYVGLLDFGISGSLVRFMTFHRERDEHRHAAAIATLGLLFYLGLGALLIPLAIASADWVAALLKLPSEFVEALPLYLGALAAIFIGGAITSVFSARLVAAHRLDLSSAATLGGGAVYLVLILLFVGPGSTIATVLACIAAQLAATVIFLSVLAARTIPHQAFASPRHLSRLQIRQLFGFGILSQITSATAVVNLEADKIIISRGIGVEQVTTYHVANRLALLNRSLPLQLLGALLPEFTARVSRGLEADELAQLYRTALRGLMLYTLLISGFVAAASGPLLLLWLGRDIEGASALTVALVISYAINNATGVGTTVFRAQGNLGYETVYGVIAAVLNVALTIILIEPYGIYGVIWGTIIGNVVGSCFFMILFHRKTRVPYWRSTGSWLSRLLLVTALSAASCLAVTWALADDRMTRVDAFVNLTAGGVAYCATFVLAGLLLSFWTSQELGFLRTPLKSVMTLGKARAR